MAVLVQRSKAEQCDQVYEVWSKEADHCWELRNAMVVGEEAIALISKHLNWN